MSVRLEMVPLSKVRRWPRNPKLHDEAGLDQSLERFGFVAPVLLDEKTGRLVAGHGRVEALERLRAAGKPPPARIQEREGEWLVPVVRGVSFADEREAEAYLLADNRLTELGGWNMVELADMLRPAEVEQQVATVGTGFSDQEAARLLRTYRPPQEAEFPEFDESVAEAPEHFGKITCEACGHEFLKSEAEEIE